MQTIGMFEAKTHLAEIIQRVEKGEVICLTKRNKEVAFIIPVSNFYINKNKDIFEELRTLKKRAPLGSAQEILDMRDEGRK